MQNRRVTSSQKKPRRLYFEDEEIFSLIDQLSESHDFEGISSSTLSAVRQTLYTSRQQLFSHATFSQANNLLQLSREIDLELQSRHRAEEEEKEAEVFENPKEKEHKEEKEKGLMKIRIRHNTLLESFDKMWKEKMKPQYFEKSRNVIMLEKKVKQNPKNQELRNKLDEEREKARKNAEEKYQQDYQRERKKLMHKQNHEIKDYLNKKNAERTRIVMASPNAKKQSQGTTTYLTSRVVSSKGSTKGTTSFQSPTSIRSRGTNVSQNNNRRSAPVKIPNLLSYTSMAHKRAPVVPVVQRTVGSSVLGGSGTTSRSVSKKATRKVPIFYEISVQAEFEDSEGDYFDDEANATGGVNDNDNNENEYYVQEEEEEEEEGFEEYHSTAEAPPLNFEKADISFKVIRSRSARNDRPHYSSKSEYKHIAQVSQPQFQDSVSHENIENYNGVEEEEEEAEYPQSEEDQPQENEDSEIHNINAHESNNFKSDSLNPSPKDEEAEADSLKPSARNEEAEVDSLGPSPKDEEAEVDSLNPSAHNEEEVGNRSLSVHNEEEAYNHIPSAHNEEADNIKQPYMNEENEIGNLPQMDKEDEESNSRSSRESSKKSHNNGSEDNQSSHSKTDHEMEINPIMNPANNDTSFSNDEEADDEG